MQLVVDVCETDTIARSLAFEADLAPGQLSADSMPDFFGGDTTPPTPNVRLVTSADAPVAFSYRRTTSVTNVTIENDLEPTALTVQGTGNNQSLVGTIEVPTGADKLYIAVVNATAASLVLQNVSVSGLGQCIPPAPPAPEPDEGCSATGASLVAAVVSALTLARRRRLSR